MSALNRKLVRDLVQMRGQAVAICLVIACGVATFVMSLSTLGSLVRTQAAYYERYRFAEAFARVKRAPLSLADRVAEIPGVSQVQTRVVVDVTLDVPGLKEPAVGRIISVPELAPPGMNGLYLRAGRYVSPGHGGEVLVSEGFAHAHHFEPGDAIGAVINGRWQRLRIVGIALSPEYVYSLREGELLPDDKRYGVFWMGYEELAAAYNMDGAFNDLTLTLAPGASEPEVLSQLDLLTEAYGGLGAFGRADQLSHKFVSNEIEELKGMAVFIPAIFLSVAAFLLNVVLSRLIGTQREQIAALKAFGYTHLEVGWHYLQMVLIIVLVGTVLGTLVGAKLGKSVTEMYTRFFHFPVFAYHLGADVVLLALCVSVGAAVLGTLGAVRRAVSLPPAEAMRPEPPATFRPTIAERLGLQRFLPLSARMILRQFERRPFRAFVSCLGIALAVSVLILGNFMLDAVNYVMDSQFQFAQRQDLTVTFVEPTSASALSDVRALPGVRHFESFRAVAARVRSGHLSRRLAILGLPPEQHLNRLMDIHRRHVPLPPEGLVVSEKLAEILHLKVGDFLIVEVMEGQRPVCTVPIVGTIADFAGVAAYMDIRALHRLMREGDTVSGAYLTVDADQIDRLYTELKKTPRVGSVTVKLAALRSFQETVAENLLRMRLFNVIFASIIAVGVVYNSARISLSERSRELATLRVIGFTRVEISKILLGELAVLVTAAIPLGFAIGYGFAAFIIHTSYNTEMFRMPLIVGRSTFAFAALVILTAAVLSGLVVRRMLDHLDLVSVLKSKE